MDERGLGKKLQEARQAAGLTQQQLCHKANLSFSTLTKIERGAIKAPSIFTIQAIATALSLSLDELIGQAAQPPRTLRKTKNGASFIYFDVNGCLVHYYQRAFMSIAAETQSDAGIVETVYWHFNDDVCRGVKSLSDFNAALAKELSVDSIDWQQHYLKAVEPIVQMQEIIRAASENYKIGLLSNIMPGLLNAMRREGLLPDINYDAIIDSSEVGAIKPELQIYEHAQQKAGCPPEEILFIDDGRTNLMAAQRLDWQVMLFDDALPEESAARVREALEPAS